MSINENVVKASKEFIHSITGDYNHQLLQLQNKDTLSKCEDQIKALQNVIACCKSIEEAEECFNVLDLYQNLLVKFYVKGSIKTNYFLDDFIRKYDRLDDPDLRSFIFNSLSKN